MTAVVFDPVSVWQPALSPRGEEKLRALFAAKDAALAPLSATLKHEEDEQ